MPEQTSRLKITEADKICTVEFVDRKILDEICIAEIEEELFRLVDSKKGLRLLVSFKNVGHFTSAALSMLLKLKRRMDDSKGVLKLSDISPQIYDVFKITQLNKKFDIHDTAQEALSSYSA